MSITTLLTAVWFLLYGLNGLGWLPLNWVILPLLAFIIGLAMLLAGFGVVNYKLPSVRRD